MEIPRIVWKGPGFTVGLTGAVGSGKSAAGREFARCGARLLDADQEAHAVLHSAALRDSLIGEFGPEIIGTDGAISRETLANIVFRDPQRKRALEALIHPGVRERYREARAALGKGEILVYDVPLLFEAGLEQDFDLVVVVSAPETVRFQRVRERSNWDEAGWRRREAAQIPLSEKEKRADVILRNDRGLEELNEQVRELYRTITSARQREEAP